ncbi:MAG: DUF2235 domain-containing protein [Crocosphaera sp.]|nr:DUF2235 domain-containing protein [Crocosphaera sp.]
MERRLIVCCDGTWQDLETGYPTNVVKMSEAIKPLDSRNGNHIYQIVYYDEGIGTQQINAKIIDKSIKFLGGGLGLGIDHKIAHAYRFLCLNYEPGDEIYLFGFSRGAYTVRCLAGLIYHSGLLRRECIREIPRAYELYRDKQKAPNAEETIKFRQDYAIRVAQYPDPFHVPIKALCCWDTVASLGLPNLRNWLKLDKKFNERYSFFNNNVNHTIEKAFHAVAIDEQRKVFDVTLMEPSEHTSDENQVTEVWFPGTHGCVGGGSEEESGLSDGALQWMMEQVEKMGLALDENLMSHPLKPDYTIPFDNTPKPPFNLFGTHLRRVQCNFEDLHESVINRYQRGGYLPENPSRPPNQINAEEIELHRRIASEMPNRDQMQNRELVKG